MENNVLLTGTSGYLGGTVLARLQQTKLPPHELFALLRDPKQSADVRKYGAEPVLFDVKDAKAVRDYVVKNKFNVVYHMIDAVTSDSQKYFIEALAEVKKITGKDVHFVHTSGAKMFSNHAGAPQGELFDNQSDLFDIQKGQKAPLPVFQTALNTNKLIIEEGEKLGVKTYIFVPCIVYGKGEGFGNKISIQTVAVYKAGKALGQVCRLDDDKNIWPVCHVSDTASLYVEMLRRILANEKLDSGRNGYYLASPGKVAWDDIYSGMAKAMHKEGLIQTAEVKKADDAEISKMAEALKCPKPFVAAQFSGQCLFTAKHGSEIGWKPQYSANHILEVLDEEVTNIQRYLP